MMPATQELHPDGRYWAYEVARILFRRDVEWFYRNRARLEAQEGFPQPISQIGRPHWKGQALIAWENRAQARKPAETDDPKVVSYDALLKARASIVAKKRRRES